MLNSNLDFRRLPRQLFLYESMPSLAGGMPIDVEGLARAKRETELRLGSNSFVTRGTDRPETHRSLGPSFDRLHENSAGWLKEN